MLGSLAQDLRRGRDPASCARAFQRGVAHGLCDAVSLLCERFALDTVVLSGGVFQNELLMQDLKLLFRGLDVWTNCIVPPNDGGISLGQAALAAFAPAHEPQFVSLADDTMRDRDFRRQAP